MAVRRKGTPRFFWSGLLILGPVAALVLVGRSLIVQVEEDAFREVHGEASEYKLSLLQGARSLLDGGVPASHRAWLEPDGFVEPLGPKQERRVYFDPPRPPVQASPQAEELRRLLEDREMSLGDKAQAAANLEEGWSAGGLPVRQLALRLALRTGREAGVADAVLEGWARALCESVCAVPSIYGEQFLEAAFPYLDDSGQRRWAEHWEEDKPFRQFFARYEGEIATMLREQSDGKAWSPRELVTAWFEGDDGERETFCVLEKNGNRYALSVYDVAALQPHFASAIDSSAKPFPDYLGARMRFGEDVVFSLRAPAGEAAIATVMDEDLRLTGEIILADYDLLREKVAERTRPVARLIAIAAFTALVGWFAAWRAFAKQRRLAAMKDNFVSAVSHELKAPVAAIGLMAEEMQNGAGKSESKRKEYTRLIAGECARLGSLVDNVLDYARIEQGRDCFEEEDTDVGDLVRAAVELMRPAASARGMEIELKAPPNGELEAVVDARAVGRALINLLDNAIKYGPEGRPVRVTTERIGAGGVRIAVADHGEPILGAERERIFERFYRCGSELTRETEGVGIGLSLVRHISRAHGGDAYVERGRDGNRFVFETSNGRS